MPSTVFRVLQESSLLILKIHSVLLSFITGVQNEIPQLVSGEPSVPFPTLGALTLKHCPIAASMPRLPESSMKAGTQPYTLLHLWLWQTFTESINDFSDSYDTAVKSRNLGSIENNRIHFLILQNLAWVRYLVTLIQAVAALCS